MGQALAKREMDKGMKQYHEQRFAEAVDEWSSALKKMTKARNKFEALGNICLALCDLGKYRDALTHSGLQIEVANDTDDPVLKSEAFLMYAICNEKLSEFTKAISYCRYCLQTEKVADRTQSYAHLCLGNAYVGLSEFPKAWGSYTKALALARTKNDKFLELMTSARVGHMFSLLTDYDTGLAYCCKAWDVVSGLPEGDPHVRYRRLLAVYIATPYRRTGRYNEAMDYCEDAMKLAMLYGDRPVQARCLLTFADIHRKRNDLERASPRYESAYSIMSETGDRLGQVEALSGMAKTATSQRDLAKATELNVKALDIAQKIGNKLEMLRCHARLRTLYAATGDETLAHRHFSVLRQLLDEMELLCGVCDEVVGERPEKLDALRCGHFIHGRCSDYLARSTLGRAGKTRPCPACRRKSSENPALYT
ncbi:43 kDa receptor-associated protein of the synapse-like [Haliotis rufescens]|uniref:43 kDa receptor-associated protein of the synapse-like n=1 Tax=Haliotis rufescens TaxID=6454 RepID=UPI001EB06A7F|nr:43 kDa receptor-associated protein of the synapse-like [Haliotis rufescens]